MNSFEIKETQTLKDVEMCIRWTCIQFGLQESVIDLAIMLARRSVKELEFNTEQNILFVLSVLLISTRFYEIHVERKHWNALCYDQFPKSSIEKCINYILSFFPRGAFDLYLDQFISPKLIPIIESKNASPISTEPTSWKNSPVLNPDFNSHNFRPFECVGKFAMTNFKMEEPKPEPKFEAPKEILRRPKPKTSIECSRCTSLKKCDDENVLDFNMFCSDECKKNFMTLMGLDDY